jgi:hypothetical protein
MQETNTKLRSSIFWDIMTCSPLKSADAWENIGRLSVDYTSLYPRRQNSSLTTNARTTNPSNTKLFLLLNPDSKNERL